MKRGTDTKSIGLHQKLHSQEELRACARALLRTPLMSPSHEDFSAVRRNADALRDWFSREAGWPLYCERDGIRLLKRPGSLGDDTRGIKDFNKRRYVLFSLACAVLERTEGQITLQVLGRELLSFAADPVLESQGFTFTLTSQHERRELVDVCKTLMGYDILARIVGDEDAYVHSTSGEGDALYDIRRRMLAGVLSAVRGPSTWPVNDLPVTFDERLHALVDEYVADSEEGRRTALRHMLARRLLDDPVIYFDELSDEAKAYFLNQRGPLAARLAEATGLIPEQRAEGVALVDEDGETTDVSMPAEGTDAHATLLVAEYLCRVQAERRASGLACEVDMEEVTAFLALARDRFGKLWRRAAREPGSEVELARQALSKLELLHLVRISDGVVRPKPALSRFSLGDAEVLRANGRADSAATSSHK